MNKKVLITGGTSGIGLAIAEKFALNKYNLILVGLEENGVVIANNIAEKNKVECMFHHLNLSDESAIVNFCNTIVKENICPDIIINNAGVQFVSPIENFPIDKWDLIMNVNLKAAFILSKMFWNSMKEKKYGRIINIASAHGLTASEFKSAYVASKHGIVGLTKVLALEGAPVGISVNAICPGYVKTPLVEKQIDDQAKAHGISKEEVIGKIMLAKQPLKEFVSTETIANMCLFLSAENSNTITGTTLSIDGGWTAQ